MVISSTVVLYPHAATIFAAACACIFVVVGVLGNLITIVALVRCPKLRTHATTAFVLSLCISDLLFCSISLPLQAIRFINKAWTLGDTLCKVFPVIFYGNVAVSLLSMVGITLNRYILIAYNSLYSKIYKCGYICLQLFFVWGFAFAMMIPPWLEVWGRLGLDEATFSCTILKNEGKSPKKILFLVGFVMPCMVIIISYTCIYWIVRRQRIKLMAHSSSNKETGYTVREREDSRLTSMMLTIFVCFCASFLPLMLVNVADDNTRYPWVHIIASILAWASSVINPFIYAASNRSYRVAYYKLLSSVKFWGSPLSPIASKSVGLSKGSRELSGEKRSISNYVTGKPSPLDINKITKFECLITTMNDSLFPYVIILIVSTLLFIVIVYKRWPGLVAGIISGCLISASIYMLLLVLKQRQIVYE